MSVIKRVAAFFVIACMLLGGVACHEKGEAVVTIEGVEIRSGIYLLFLIQADTEFKSNVDTAATENETSSITGDAYYDQTVDDVTAVDWITNQTVEYCKEYVLTTKLFEKYNLKLTDETQVAVDYYTNYYWDSGYSDSYEANGVSQETFRLFYENMFMQEKLFEYYYDKPDDNGVGGLEQVSEEDILSNLEENYVLTESFSAPTVDADEAALGATELAALKTELEGYAKRINAGESLAYVKAEYEKKGTTDDTTSDTSSTDSSTDTSSTGTSSDSEEVVSIYPNATTVASDGDNYALFKAIETFDTAVVLEGESTYIVAVKRDILKDKEYQLETYRRAILHNIKDDAFEEMIANSIAEYEVVKDESLIKYYSPTKIVEAS